MKRMVVRYFSTNYKMYVVVCMYIAQYEAIDAKWHTLKYKLQYALSNKCAAIMPKYHYCSSRKFSHEIYIFVDKLYVPQKYFTLEFCLR